MKKKFDDNDAQVRLARTEIMKFGKQIGDLEQLDKESIPEVQSTIDFLKLAIKLRIDALRKQGLSPQLPHGQEKVQSG